MNAFCNVYASPIGLVWAAQAGLQNIALPLCCGVFHVIFLLFFHVFYCSIFTFAFVWFYLFMFSFLRCVLWMSKATPSGWLGVYRWVRQPARAGACNFELCLCCSVISCSQSLIAVLFVAGFSFFWYIWHVLDMFLWYSLYTILWYCFFCSMMIFEHWNFLLQGYCILMFRSIV